MLVFSDVPLGADDGAGEIVPAFAERMAAVWRAAFAACGPFASLASMTGMHQARVARIVAAGTVATRQEGRTIDAALGTNATKFFPKHSASIAQGAAVAPSSVRSVRGETLTDLRQARVAKWDAKLVAYGKSLDELSIEARIARPRLDQIFLSGARMTWDESASLTRVLGHNDGYREGPPTTIPRRRGMRGA